MVLTTKTAVISTAATAAQTLPENAVYIRSVTQLVGGATSVSAQTYTVVTGTPGAGQVQFTGTPESPSNTIMFSAAQTAGGLLLVNYVPVGGIQAAA